MVFLPVGREYSVEVDRNVKEMLTTKKALDFFFKTRYNHIRELALNKLEC